MECSIRRSSTIRRTDRIYQEPPADSTYKHVSLRISTHDEERKDASPDQLFSLFISLVAEVHRNTDEVKQGFLSGIMHKDVEAADFGSQFVGKGRSFGVRCLKFEPPDRPLALKSVLPFENFTSREEKERLGDVILELRALSHPWLRGHPNIIQLLGLGWETDSANISRKWPVLILEYADGGTLGDFLQRHPDMTFQERLKLCLDVLNGLDALHRCAIVHGDLKPLNVLVCLEHNDGNDKTWTATLADFGGSVLDVGENERGCLTMGSFPWQAPEWMDWLSREELLATDLYSLGLLIWSVMANGLDPVKNDLAIFGLEQYSANFDALQEQVLKFKSSRPSQFLECLMQAATGKFAPDVDRELIVKALAVTAVKESKSRSIKVLRSLLEHGFSKDRGPITANHDPKLEQEEKVDLSFAPITKISNIENILMGPDMLDTLTPTVNKYVKERLQHTFQQSIESEQKASAAFSLSIDALRTTHELNSVDDCLLWLIRSAQKGNQSAQSLVLRFHRALNRKIPTSIQNEVNSWIIHAAERNYPAAQEDLHLVLASEECQKVWQRIRSRYANTGVNRFAALYKGMTSTMEQLDRDMRDRMIQSMQSPNFQKDHFKIDEHGDNLLHFAASSGLSSAVSLWERPMPVNINDLGRFGESALLHACRSGHFTIAMMLLDLGADPTLQSVAGDTPLHWICSFEGAEAECLARKLVASGAVINAVAKDHNYPWAPLCNYERGTPLHRAVGKGRVDAIKALLKVGAAANHLGDRLDKKCPIYLASQYYYPEILELLLKSLGTLSPAAEPYRGFSLLIAAIHGNDLYGLRFSMIARHGENWQLNLQGTVDVLLKHGAAEHLHGFPVGFDCAGTTPLQVAVGMGSPEVLRYLLQKGCISEINKRTFVWYFGAEMLPLVTAIYRARKEVFDMLLAHGADIFQPHYDEDGKQLSYLWQCAFAGHDDVSFARTLVARGIEVDQRHPGYETAFAAAVRNRCFELAKFLLDNGADPNAEFHEGHFLESSDAATVLGFLIREQTRSALGAIDWLLREAPGMRFIISSSKKHSVLHVCASAKAWTRNEAEEGGCKLIADAMMAYFKPTKEQVNLKDADGQTALYCATITNNYVMTKILLDAGADPRIENNDGLSALDANAVFLQMLAENDNRLVDETDPRPFTKQIKRRMENQKIISECFASFST